MAKKAIVLGLTAGLAGLLAAGNAASKAGRESPVTFNKDVAPILAKNCQGCHRPGEVGPFALTNYKQARRWATDSPTGS